jgi:hypothetical protein
MSQSKQTRSTFSIHAVAQAAAEGAAIALSPVKKLDAIAALAGFVLRLFRRTGSPCCHPPAARRKAPGNLSGISREGTRCRPRRRTESCPARVAPQVPASNGGTRHG